MRIYFNVLYVPTSLVTKLLKVPRYKKMLDFINCEGPGLDPGSGQLRSLVI